MRCHGRFPPKNSPSVRLAPENGLGHESFPQHSVDVVACRQALAGVALDHLRVGSLMRRCSSVGRAWRFIGRGSFQEVSRRASRRGAGQGCGGECEAGRPLSPREAGRCGSSDTRFRSRGGASSAKPLPTDGLPVYWIRERRCNLVIAPIRVTGLAYGLRTRGNLRRQLRVLWTVSSQ
jgi:hypothetical protein